MTLKLLSYNIRYGGTGRDDSLITVINSCAPDLVVLQEATDPRVVERVAAGAGMKTWAARAGHSVAFLSRLEIEHYDWHRPAGARHPFLEVKPAGLNCRVFGLHLSAIHSNWTERRRVRELRSLLGLIGKEARDFHILTGDFNTLAPGEELDVRRLPPRLRPLVWLSGGRIRWQTIQMMLDGGYLDAFRTLNANDAGYTFPTWNPHVRLDYLFLPAAEAARLTLCRVVTDAPEVAQASDHFPLLAHLNLD